MKILNKESMKGIGFIVVMVLFALYVGVSGCHKDLSNSLPGSNKQESRSTEDATGKNAKITFWNNQNSIGAVTVLVDGTYSGTISYSKEAKACDESGCATFSLAYGRHTFTATATTGETWKGSFWLSKRCTLYQLY